MKAEIVSIGRELLMGETQDTNATFLAKQMPLLGIELHWVSEVGDVQSEIVEVLRRAWGRSDLVLTTGGLGPTGDDLTRESVAETMGETMSVVPELEEALRERFRRLGTNTMPESNLKQCTLIPCAEAIPNAQGTAPGWWVEKDGRILLCMPGPPREMHAMWETQVRERLQEKSKFVILARNWKTFGHSEGAVGEMTFPLFPTDNPSLGVYAKPDGIHVELKVTAPTEAEARQMLSDGEAKIRKALGDSIWGIDDETLEDVVGRLLVEHGLSLAVMEDYTAGLVTSSLSEIHNSREFLSGGVVAMTEGSKIALGVPRTVVQLRGGVSEETSIAMAMAVKERFTAGLGLGVTGIESTQPNSAVYYAFVGEKMGHHVLARPRDRQRLKTSIFFELRKILLDGRLKSGSILEGADRQRANR
jgi:nicotinamide-nucleotide amidase